MRGTQRCTAIDAIVFDTNDGLKLMDKTIHFQCQKASQWTDDWIFTYASCNKLGRSWVAVFPKTKVGASRFAGKCVKVTGIATPCISLCSCYLYIKRLLTLYASLWKTYLNKCHQIFIDSEVQPKWLHQTVDHDTVIRYWWSTNIIISLPGASNSKDTCGYVCSI